MSENTSTSGEGRNALVAGATGTAGRAYVNELVSAGYRVRGIVRPDSDSSSLIEAGATPVEADLQNEDDAHDVVSATDAVFIALLGRGEETAADERVITQNVIDAARAESVEHIVYTSVHGADEKTGVPHFEVKDEIEAYLEAAGLTYTILRPTTYMDALSAPWLRSGIEENGVLSSPIQEGVPISYLDTADLATVGRLALDTDVLQNRTLPIGGPRPVTYQDLLPVFERLTGTSVTYRNVPLAQVETQMGADIAAMVRYFNDNGFTVENDPILDPLDIQLTDVDTYLTGRGRSDRRGPEELG